jgi:hypothetical protein
VDFRFVAAARLSLRDQPHEPPFVVVAIDADAGEELTARCGDLGGGWRGPDTQRGDEHAEDANPQCHRNLHAGDSAVYARLAQAVIHLRPALV